ncbi:AraC-like DNA-binding protein [Bradyrhizobium japonicum]
MLIDALAKIACPGPPAKLICRSGHRTVLWKSTTLLHAVDADEHRIDPRAQLRPPTPAAVANMLPARLGKSAEALGDAVRMASDFAQRVDIVERWVGSMLESGTQDCAIGLSSRMMVAAGGRARIKDCVAKSGLSASQFQRRFATQVGMAPKLFARTIRFDRALASRRNTPSRSWKDIIHELGYFDQADFIRERHAFAGLPPGGLVGEWDNIFFPADD